MVFIDGMLSYFKEILNVLLSLNINRLELLKFHSLGHNKYKRLSLEYKNFTPSDDSYLKFYNVLTNNGIKVEMLKI
jgi:pyruvate-formate lyase-activating enzyme